MLQRVVPDRPTTTGAPAEGVADVAGGESGWLGAVVRSTHGMLPSDLLRVVQTAACARLGSATENAGLTPATSAPGLDSRPSHLHQDWGLDVLAAARALRAASLRDTTAVGRDPRLALALALTVPCRAGPVPCPLPSPSPHRAKCRAVHVGLSHRRRIGPQDCCLIDEGLQRTGRRAFTGGRRRAPSCGAARSPRSTSSTCTAPLASSRPAACLCASPHPTRRAPPQHSVLSAAQLRATPCKASITRSAVRVCVRVCVCVPVCAHACAFVCVRVLVRACVCAYLCVRAGTGKRRRDGGTAGFAMRWCSYGAAGTGKTSLVRAVCSESNVPSIVLNATEASEPHRLAAPRRPSPS